MRLINIFLRKRGDDKLIIKSIKNELKLIYRDAILLMMMLFIIYLGVVLRFLIPWANTFMIERSLMPGSLGNMQLVSYYPLILTFMVLFTGPQLSGAIFGLLILSDKDEQVIKALMITPMSSAKYIKRRAIASWTLGTIFILVLFYMIGINVDTLWKNVVIAMGGGLTAPLIMLFLGITSESKVQGMNYGKILSLFGILLLISWFVNGNLQFVFGILPYYWISKAYWNMDTGNIWLLYVSIGIVYQAVVVLGMSKLFNKKLYKTF